MEMAVVTAIHKFFERKTSVQRQHQYSRDIWPGVLNLKAFVKYLQHTNIWLVSIYTSFFTKKGLSLNPVEAFHPLEMGE
jgi:hypothetical protein